MNPDISPGTDEVMIPRRLSGRLLWGLIDQGASSATNFALSLLAGRLVGASGLGVVAVGFSVYLVILVFQRALISEPCVIASSTSDLNGHEAGTRASASATILFGSVGTVGMLVVGLSLGGPIGRGFLLFAPWILPALLQDLWRMLLFRDGRGRAAASNDAIWLLGMASALPLVLMVRSEAIIVASWGFGAFLAALIGFLQLRARLGRPAESWAWIRTEAWPLGRWLAAEAAVYNAVAQLTVFLIAGLLGTAPLGGLRSVQVIFAPLSLLTPAIAIPALPVISETLKESRQAARLVAMKVSIVLVTLTILYLLVAGLNREALLALVFGSSFIRYEALVWPVGVTQILSALAGGAYLFLKASRQGSSLLFARSVMGVSMLCLMVTLAIPYDIEGAAWGVAIGTGVGTGVALYLALRRERMP